MVATVVSSPYSAILDLTGQGLTLGALYIGAANQDPQVNPQAVYWDQALTVPASQPLQVSAGYIMRDGTPAAAFTSGDYSIRALDHNGAQVFYRATNIGTSAAADGGRQRLTANTDFYVATTGSDTTGTGTSGNPWATIQKATTVLQASYDLAGYVATIHVGAGIFNGVIVSGPFTGATGGTGSLVISGEGAGVTTVRGAAGFAAFAIAGGAALTIGNMTLGGTGDYGLDATMGAVIAFGSVAFAAVSGAHIRATRNGVILCIGSYSITAGAAQHYFAYGGGFIGTLFSALVCTVTGTPAFSGSFAAATDNGVLEVQSSALTFSGGATGTRYFAIINGTINTFGSGAAYFPGNVAGSVSTNGVYI